MTTTKLIKEYEKIKASYDLIKLSKGKGITDIQISEIPEKKERFLNTDSFWQRALIPIEEENFVSACYFWGAEEEEFDSHKHKTAGETIQIMNKDGCFEYISETGERGIAKFGDVTYFPPDKGHWVKWLTPTLSLITWSPPFVNGWGAEFKDKDK